MQELKTLHPLERAFYARVVCTGPSTIGAAEVRSTTSERFFLKYKSVSLSELQNRLRPNG